MNFVREIKIAPSPETDVVQVLFAGDLCPIGRNSQLFIEGYLDKIYSDLWPVIKNADTAIVNLECPLTDYDVPLSKVGPHVRARPECMRGIQAAFPIVGLANNHIMDYGGQGLADTLDVCQRHGVLSVGAGQRLADAQQALAITINDVRIAILSITEHEFSIAGEDSPGAAPIDLAHNYRQISQAHSQADLVFVLVHGGNEHYPLPSPRLVKVCHFLADVGSHLVVCNHTHIASGIEVYRGVPIVYGQGNFIFDRSHRPSHWYTGYLLAVRASRQGVASLTVIPYMQPREGVSVRRMQGEAAEEFLQEFDRLSDIIVNPGALNHAWQDFCRTRQASYLASLLPGGRWVRRLMRLGIRPSTLLGPKRANEWLHLFRCESHRDVVVQILKEFAVDHKE